MAHDGKTSLFVESAQNRHLDQIIPQPTPFTFQNLCCAILSMETRANAKLLGSSVKRRRYAKLVYKLQNYTH